jgi:hypothetical protein
MSMNVVLEINAHARGAHSARSSQNLRRLYEFRENFSASRNGTEVALVRNGGRHDSQ